MDHKWKDVHSEEQTYLRSTVFFSVGTRLVQIGPGNADSQVKYDRIPDSPFYYMTNNFKYLNLLK